MGFSDLAMIAGFFAAGFAGVWVFLTLRQSEDKKPGAGEDDRG